MKKSLKFMAIATLVTTTLIPSALADSRHPRETISLRDEWRSARRVSVEGRITDVDRERNGIVITLDRGRHTLVADSRYSRLRNGTFVRATGVVGARGFVYVNDIDLVRDRDRDDALIAGTVERVDERRGILYVRDGRSRSVIQVDVRDVRIGNVRRGDRVTVRGEWERNGTFEADRIDVDRR